MVSETQTLAQQLQEHFGESIRAIEISHDIVTLEIDSKDLLKICITLRDTNPFHFEMLMDVCGVDYLQYGLSDWETHDTTNTGFSRGVEPEMVDLKDKPAKWQKPRFAVVYHLLSLKYNHRLRLRTFVDEETMIVPTVTEIWSSANWYEREAFDLFGIFFDNHPDLRRILTDYGFIGHPFRKDFPLIGTREVRYSAADQRVIYEPVSIQERTLVPKTIREDNRYLE